MGHFTSPHEGSRGSEHRLLDSVSGHVCRWQIDPPCQSVTGEILPEVDQLQAGANGVGHPHEFGVAAALQAEHDSTHGVGRPATVIKEFDPGGIVGFFLILLKRIDQVCEGIDGKAGLVDRLRERDKNWMSWAAGEAVHKLLPPVGQRCNRLPPRGCLVGKVVGPAGKRVDVREMLPQPSRYEERSHGEVFIMACCHGPTEPPGGSRIASSRYRGQFPGGRVAVSSGRRQGGHATGQGGRK